MSDLIELMNCLTLSDHASLSNDNDKSEWGHIPHRDRLIPQRDWPRHKQAEGIYLFPTTYYTSPENLRKSERPYSGFE